VTIAGKLSEDLVSGTTNSILKQAKLKVQKIIEPEPDPETVDEDNLEELN
jgi:hypothetical protein